MRKVSSDNVMIILSFLGAFMIIDSRGKSHEIEHPFQIQIQIPFVIQFQDFTNSNIR